MTTTIEIPAYIEMLKLIGIPGIVAATQGRASDELMKIAKLNKVSLLYSATVNDDQYHSDLLLRYQLLLDTLVYVCSSFNEKAIKYCIFKTIKPFPTTPSDIDVLVSKEDFGRAEALLMASGFNRIAYDTYSSTLEKETIVDLQLQPSVSNMPYVPTALLMQNTILKNINGVDVRTLNPEAELIVIASHSFYKEQMFTLNDYYTTTLLAESVDPENLLNLAKRANVLEPVQIIVGLCSQITKSVFNEELKILELGHTLKAPNTYSIRDMPLKFPLLLVIKLLISRVGKDEDIRRNIVPAIMRIASPRQLFKLLSHMTRSTY